MKQIKYKLTVAESSSFNAFAEERVMAAKAYRPSIHMSAEQEDHLCACFFNCISDAYASGMATPNRRRKPEALGLRNLRMDITRALNFDRNSKKVLAKLAERVDILAKQYKKSNGGKK